MLVDRRTLGPAKKRYVAQKTLVPVHDSSVGQI